MVIGLELGISEGFITFKNPSPRDSGRAFFSGFGTTSDQRVERSLAGILTVVEFMHDHFPQPLLERLRTSVLDAWLDDSTPHCEVLMENEGDLKIAFAVARGVVGDSTDAMLEYLQKRENRVRTLLGAFRCSIESSAGMSQNETNGTMRYSGPSAIHEISSAQNRGQKPSRKMA